jgi:hypothetical protein
MDGAGGEAIITVGGIATEFEEFEMEPLRWRLLISTDRRPAMAASAATKVRREPLVCWESHKSRS